MKRNLVNFTRGSQLLGHFSFMFAAGLKGPSEIGPQHILRRVSRAEVSSFAEIYPQLEPGALLNGSAEGSYAGNWALADASTFTARPVKRVLVEA